MGRFDTVILGGTAVLPQGSVVRADIGIRDGKIVAMADQLNASDGESIIDARDRIVVPGAVDAHFHLGIYRPLEDDTRSETGSALVGGVTTVLSYFRTGKDYLNRSGPYREIFPEVLDRVRGNAYTDYGFHLAIMTNAQLEEIPWLVQHGVASFKYYMFYKALTLNANSTNAAAYTMADTYDLGHLYRMMTIIAEENAKNRGRISLSIHCENAELIRVFIEDVKQAGGNDLKAYSDARPALSESLAIAEALVLAEETGCPMNFLHLSSSRAVRDVVRWRNSKAGANARTETTLHHLALTYDKTFGGLNGKVNPPIRDAKEVEALWQAVLRGEVDQVVSDHAAIPDEKPNDLWEAHAGFGGTALLYPVLISEGYHKRGLSLGQVVNLASANPAATMGLVPQKGMLAVGADADIAIIDLNQEKTVTPQLLLSAQPFTPFEGMVIKGWPVTTLVRGQLQYQNGDIVGKPTGQFLSRPVVNGVEQ
ncbi:MAG: dihydropyrimidinase [Sulfobacillus benefaciens]|uniref:Dihydropyrimidinase n=1 Tax=Sulfobacillus benefaciens TaxID=453960 RepID=A0A2T2XM13_9FIRM|nr:MAG: dihydropyrimidinase [Sulfobacillus benefaciens]